MTRSALEIVVCLPFILVGAAALLKRILGSRAP